MLPNLGLGTLINEKRGLIATQLDYDSGWQALCTEKSLNGGVLVLWWPHPLGVYMAELGQDALVEGILPKGPYPPCLRMADRALLAEYPRSVSLTTGKCYYYRVSFLGISTKDTT